MYINHAGLPGNRGITPQAETPAASNGTSDVNFFNAQLSHTDQSGKGTPPAMAADLFSLGASESTTLSRRVSKGFRDESLNKKTKAAHEFTQSLSEAHLNLTARVKVLSSLVKGVDKVATMG
ncbi:hypothetical protein [Pseudomonas fildesensis]|uniref:Uncharacterized protein n=1 Tax=Pseudomonas fildesensis TaxID=1674920 RepID=A0A0J8FYQ8_9PSED|nr:hypothetical protein [Pseudomonas fildesensis]KMT55275.1 hypothetical protein ACR52_11960 [Pseudomonas fildesensis]